MLDRPLARLFAPLSAGTAARVPAGLAVAVALLAGVGAFAAILMHRYPAALPLLVVNRLCDWLVPAANARAMFLKCILNALFWGALAFAFGLADPAHEIAASFLVLALGFSNASYLAFGMIAARQSAPNDAKHAILFPGGLIENTETFAAFALACVMPGSFGIVAYVLGILCFATAGSRIAEALVTFSES